MRYWKDEIKSCRVAVSEVAVSVRNNKQGKELGRLSRAELLELLLEQTKELDKVTKERDHYRDLCDKKEAVIAESGSAAEAALRLSGVFEAAKKAADEYLANIRMANGDMPEEKPSETAGAVKKEEAEGKEDPYPAQDGSRMALGPA